MADRPIPAPTPTPETEVFWAAAREQKFLLRRCTVPDCRRHHWYPRALCPFCFGATEWVEGSGEGTIYSFSIMQRADPPFATAFVTLAEGPTMLTNLVACDFASLGIGQAVRLHWTATEGGPPVPTFTPNG